VFFRSNNDSWIFPKRFVSLISLCLSGGMTILVLQESQIYLFLCSTCDLEVRYAFDIVLNKTQVATSMQVLFR
jgi:hypothetical protein